MMARVLTVKSITDWKVRIGGNCPELAFASRRAIRACRAGQHDRTGARR